MATMAELLDNSAQRGTLAWIGLSPDRRAAIESVTQVLLEAKTGLVGDHHARSGRSKRQVTIIQAEHLPVVAALLRQNEVKPEQVRRNLMVRGINVLALKTERFRIGDCLLEGTGNCHPCSRMNETLGPGGYHAMRGHGGITAIVLEGGTIHLGDPVHTVPKEAPAQPYPTNPADQS